MLKKEARGSDNSDFGEVQEVGKNYVMMERGVLNKERIYLPKYVVEGFDGHTLWFNTKEGDLLEFRRDSPPLYDDYAKYRKEGVLENIEVKLPLIETRTDLEKKGIPAEKV